MFQKYTLTLNLWRKISRRYKNILSQGIYDDKKNSKKSLYILKDGASGVQAGDIEQVNVYNLYTIQ